MSIGPFPADQHPSVAESAKPNDAVAASCRLRRRERLVYVVIAFWLIGLACLFAPAVNGQEKYKTIKMKYPQMATEKNARRVVGAAKSFATGGRSSRLVDLYFKNYVPAVLTNEEYQPRVSKVTRDYSDILSRAERSGVNLKKIHDYAFLVMGAIAAGDYQPSARISAITILARLDSRPANTSGKTPPVPLGKVLPALILLYEDANNIDGVRAAALHGIHRHVNYGFQRIPVDLKAKLTTMMNGLLDSDPPQGRSDLAHAYMQRFAVDILDKLRKKGDTSLGEKLILISTERSKPSLIALHSARRIGEMGAELKGKVADPSDVLDRWSRRALAVLESNLDRLEALDRAEPAGGPPPNPAGFGSEGSGNAGNDSSAGTSRKKKGGGLGGLGGDMSSKPRRAEADEPDNQSNGLSGIGFGNGGSDRGAKKKAREPKPGENQPPEVLASRRKINHAFQQLHIGVTGSGELGKPSRTPGGLLALVAPEVKPKIEEWVLTMQQMVDEINDEYLTTRKEYLAVLELQIDLLREAVGEEPVAKPSREGEAPAESVTSREDAASAELIASEPVAGN